MSLSLKQVQLIVSRVPVSADPFEAPGTVMEGVRHRRQVGLVVADYLAIQKHPGVSMARCARSRSRRNLRFHGLMVFARGYTPGDEALHATRGCQPDSSAHEQWTDDRHVRGRLDGDVLLGRKHPHHPQVDEN